MTPRELLAELDALGTAQNRKVYARHGARAPIAGVSYANLGKLRKRIGVDQALAEALWQSGNHDARLLAGMIADADGMTMSGLAAWLRGCDSYPVTDALAGVAARGPLGERCAIKWMGARGQWPASAGWNVLAKLLVAGTALTTIDLRERIAYIEAQIHGSDNRVRHNMNNALIAIGSYGVGLAGEAMAAAGRIGTVEVDHGETSCKTPDAAGYIRRTRAHLAKKQAAKKQAAKKQAAKKQTVKKQAVKKKAVKKKAVKKKTVKKTC